MDGIKLILSYIFVIAALIGIAVGSHYSSLFRWIIIGIFILISIVVCFFVWILSCGDDDSYMEKKWGREWKQLIAEGKLGEMTPYKCTPNSMYANRAEIESKLQFKLPNFKITYCEESLGHFTGDYVGKMIIEFEEDIKSRTMKIHGNDIDLYENGQSIFYDLSEDSRRYWHLTMVVGSKKGIIEYGYR